MNTKLKEQVAALVRLYMQQQSLDEKVKEVKDQIKESGGNPVVACSVAKAIASSKVDDLKNKAETTVDMIALARS